MTNNKDKSSVSSHMPNTPDIQKERLLQLKQLFPDLFDGEGNINADELKLIAGEQSISNERYEFNWSGKRNAKLTAYKPTTATLTKDEKRSVFPDKANGNVIIEGENLESLKCLLAAYRGGIKCIYIDPPYNTGNDFVYSDNYTEDRKAYWEESGGVQNGIKVDTSPDNAGRFHSNWLSMIYPRLLVARQLLKEDGVIYISIDDNEVHNLRRLMDEVFGEECFIAQFVWKRRSSSALAENKASTDHEYVICYGRENFTELVGLEKEFSSYRNPDNDERGDWVAGDLTVGMTASMRPNQAYDLVDPETGNVYPFNPNRVWAYIPESMDKLIQERRVLFPDNTDRRPMLKRFRSNLKDTHNPISTLLSDVGLNTESTRQIQSIFGGSYFEYSKPVSLIKALISQVQLDKDDIVLDYFSGSGVLAHGILELISEKKLDCKFMLVQLPEQFKISSEAYKAGYKKLSDLCIERVKRIIEGYGENPQPIDAGFNVFRLTKSHFPRVEFSPDPELSDEENLQDLEDYIKEKESQLTGLFEPKDILDEVLLKNGFKLNYSLEEQSQFKKNTIWLADDQGKSSLICLDQTLHVDTVNALLAEPTEFICLEQSLTTDDKWNLRKHLAHRFIAF